MVFGGVRGRIIAFLLASDLGMDGSGGTIDRWIVSPAPTARGARYRLHPVSIEVTLEPGDPTEVIDSALREIERLKAQRVITEEEYQVLRDRAAKESQ